MPAFARYRFLPALLLVCCPPFLTAAEMPAAEKPAVPAPLHTTQPAPFIVVGFVGGFVRHNNPDHGPVIFAQETRPYLPKGSFLQVFENRHRKAAYRAILRQLDTNRDGILSVEEKARAQIILYGHSWGASAAIMLARDLKRAGVPVLLTVQVDSVAKPWQRDEVIPDNVARAANFYQPHGIIHGRSRIRAQDSSKTEILGNFRFDYRKSPVACRGYSWADRAFTSSHMQIECDPNLWSRIELLVLDQTHPNPGVIAALPQP